MTNPIPQDVIDAAIAAKILHIPESCKDEELPLNTQESMRRLMKFYDELQRARQVVPEGWKLVPIEATPKMRIAAISSSKDGAYFTHNEIYNEMLAHAPQPPTQQATDQQIHNAALEQQAKEASEGKLLDFTKAFFYRADLSADYTEMEVDLFVKGKEAFMCFGIKDFERALKAIAPPQPESVKTALRKAAEIALCACDDAVEASLDAITYEDGYQDAAININSAILALIDKENEA
jgi:hypothetical protein